MYCPRLDHFVRLNPEKKIAKCGHMVNPPMFDSFELMQSSHWLQSVRRQMEHNVWPNECIRCQQTESIDQSSIRLYSITAHEKLKEINPDYLIVGGVLDNICNSACQSCNAGLSTKIGNLEHGNNFPVVNNRQLLDQLPMDRIIQLDLNGGEPTASPAYRQLLENLPKSIRNIRLNTNASRMLPNIENLLLTGIELTVTISLDGTDRVHDYVRWPILWNKFTDVVDQYVELRSKFNNLSLNFWTTVHALNVGYLADIVDYANKVDIDWSYGLLELPNELNIKYQNSLTEQAKKKLSLSTNEICSKLCNIIGTYKNNHMELDEFIARQDSLRNIKISQYINT